MPARASAERPANLGNVPAHPTVLLSLRGDATALDHGMGESRTDRLSVRVGSVGNRMSRIGKKGGAPCRASRVTYRAISSSGARHELKTTDPLPITISGITRQTITKLGARRTI